MNQNRVLFLVTNLPCQTPFGDVRVQSGHPYCFGYRAIGPVLLRQLWGVLALALLALGALAWGLRRWWRRRAKAVSRA